MTNNLVIGLWGNLPPSTLQVFLRSLRSTGYEGDICVFGFRISEDSARLLKENDVIFRSAIPFLERGYDVQSSRYFMYQAFIGENCHKYDNVMLTDTKDVAFQSDPFSGLSNSEIIFAIERLRIEQCPVNSAWITAAFGKIVYSKIRNHRISCSGTTIGSTSLVLSYLSKMNGLMRAKATVQHIKGIDQGLHNYVVHVDPPRGSEFDWKEGVVSTLHYVDNESIKISDNKIFIDDFPTAVVHQWDRKENLVEFLNKRYGSRAPHTKPIVKSPSADSSDVVLVYYIEGRDATSIELFCLTLRSAGFFGRLIIVAQTLDDSLNSMKARFHAEIEIAVCAVNDIAVSAGNWASHIGFGKWIQNNNFKSAVAFDSPDAWFVYNPFDHLSKGLSFVLESSRPLSESPVNVEWISQFQSYDTADLSKSIVSSNFVAGDMVPLRAFYADLMSTALSVARPELLDKSIQGAFNLIANSVDRLGCDVNIRPNGSLAYFSIWTDDETIDNNSFLDIDGLRPSIIIQPGRDLKVVPILEQIIGRQRISVSVGAW